MVLKTTPILSAASSQTWRRKFPVARHASSWMTWLQPAALPMSSRTTRWPRLPRSIIYYIMYHILIFMYYVLHIKYVELPVLGKGLEFRLHIRMTCRPCAAKQIFYAALCHSLEGHGMSSRPRLQAYILRFPQL